MCDLQEASDWSQAMKNGAQQFIAKFMSDEAIQSIFLRVLGTNKTAVQKMLQEVPTRDGRIRFICRRLKPYELLKKQEIKKEKIIQALIDYECLDDEADDGEQTDKKRKLLRQKKESSAAELQREILNVWTHEVFACFFCCLPGSEWQNNQIRLKSLLQSS